MGRNFKDYYGGHGELKSSKEIGLFYDDLPIGHVFKIHSMAIVIRSLIDLSEGIDVNKTSNSRECSFCHYYYFLDINFNYQKYLCDGCHDMSMKVNNIQNLAIVYFKGNAYSKGT